MITNQTSPDKMQSYLRQVEIVLSSIPTMPSVEFYSQMERVMNRKPISTVPGKLED